MGAKFKFHYIYRIVEGRKYGPLECGIYLLNKVHQQTAHNKEVRLESSSTKGPGFTSESRIIWRKIESYAMS